MLSVWFKNCFLQHFNGKVRKILFFPSYWKAWACRPFPPDIPIISSLLLKKQAPKPFTQERASEPLVWLCLKNMKAVICYYFSMHIRMPLRAELYLGSDLNDIRTGITAFRFFGHEIMNLRSPSTLCDLWRRRRKAQQLEFVDALSEGPRVFCIQLIHASI